MFAISWPLVPVLNPAAPVNAGPLLPCRPWVAGAPVHSLVGPVSLVLHKQASMHGCSLSGAPAHSFFFFSFVAPCSAAPLLPWPLCLQEHLFIICELLRANLYEFQKYNRDSGGEVYFTMPRLQVHIPLLSCFSAHPLLRLQLLCMLDSLWFTFRLLYSLSPFLSPSLSLLQSPPCPFSCLSFCFSLPFFHTLSASLAPTFTLSLLQSPLCSLSLCFPLPPSSRSDPLC